MRRLRTLGISLALAACAALISALLYLAPLNSATFANRVADYRVLADALEHPGIFVFRNAPDRSEPNDKLSLIQLDEASIGNTRAGLGNWPFPRSVYGRLLGRLSAAGAAVVAFDIDFLEPSADPTQDKAFAAAACCNKGSGKIQTVIGYPVTTTTRGIPGAELPPPILQKSMSLGFTTIDSPGGIIIGQPQRIAPMPPGFPGGAAISLAYRTDELYSDLVPARSRMPAAKGLRHLANTATLPTLDGEMLLLPFAALSHVDTTGRAGAQTLDVGFVSQTMSFADALTAPIGQLRTFASGKIILVGATAQGLADLAPTVNGIYPGVFIHARLIDQLARGTFIRPAPPWLNLALIFVLPLLLAVAFSRLRPALAIVVGIIVVLAYAELSAYSFIYRLYWLDLVHVELALILAMLAVAAYRVLTESSERRFVTELFGRHVSPALVEDILRSDDPKSALALSGKLVKATIFYSDIRGFTAMSERMTAEAIYDQLNEYFEAMCAIIFKYGGYVDKFIGDCIMVAFSAPVQTPNDARKAVDAALDQQQTIAQLAVRWREEGREPFTVGMGINTGNVVMGNLGASSRMNYTVIGDDVNIAARLYNVAAGGQIVISESTYNEVKQYFIVRELEPVSVKGKSAPLRNFEVLARQSA